MQRFVELTKRTVPQDDQLPETIEETLVGGVAWIVYQQIRRDEAEQAEDLLPELSEFMLAPFQGAARRRRSERRLGVEHSAPRAGRLQRSWNDFPAAVTACPASSSRKTSASGCSPRWPSAWRKKATNGPRSRRSANAPGSRRATSTNSSRARTPASSPPTTRRSSGYGRSCWPPAPSARTGPRGVLAALTALLDLFAAETAQTQLVLVEGLRAGRGVYDRYQVALQSFVPYLTDGAPAPEEGSRPPHATDEAVVGGIASLLARRVLAGRNQDDAGVTPGDRGVCADALPRDLRGTEDHLCRLSAKPGLRGLPASVSNRPGPPAGRRAS